MADQREPDIPDDITDITAPSFSVPRISAWTGRLPPEIFIKILKVLGEKGAPDAASLCRLQRTSSAVYNVVTPILYQDLNLTAESALKLVDVFHHIPPAERKDIIEQTPAGSDDSHPMDMHIVQRLRWTLSQTRSITLIIPLNQRQNPVQLEKFQQYDAAMTFFGVPPPWSGSKEINIYFDLGVTDRSHECDQSCDIIGSDLCYDEFVGAASISLIKCFVADLYPDHLRIQIPSPSEVRDLAGQAPPSGHTSWPFSSLRAKNVTMLNVTIGTQGCPQANESLAIGFSGYYDNLHHYIQGWPQNWLDERTAELIYWSDRQSGLKKLIIVGFERGLVGFADAQLSQDSCDEQLALTIIECWKRLYGGTKGDLLYRIIPWSEWTDELYPEKTGVSLSARALRKEV